MRTTSDVPKANVLGVAVSAINLAQTTQLILEAVRQNRKGYVTLTNVYGVSEAQADPQFRHILNSAFLNTPDGMPICWVGRFQGFKAMDRVYGPDLMLELCAASTNGSVRHFLYGGAPGVAEALRSSLESRFPGLCVCGTHSPPFRPLNREEETDLVKQMESLRPDIFWVGLGAPKQERFMAAYLDKLAVRIMIGVGAAFDMHSGRVRQAPYWMQRSGLEWCFRLTQEPGRLWKRYLINNPLFLARILAQFTGLKRYSIVD